MGSKKWFFSLISAAFFGAVFALILAAFFLNKPGTGVVPPPSATPPPVALPESVVSAPPILSSAKIAPSAANLQSEFTSVIEQAMPAVVLITAQKRVGVITPYFDFFSVRRKIDYMEVPSGQGSGFFIREDGLILTNFHVVRDQDSFWITGHDGKEYPAQVAAVDPPTDLALLKITDAKGQKFPTLPFADPESVQIGQWAIAIGAPFSLSSTATIGVVSNKKRSGVGVNLYENYIQTDASINPGNSGGPLLNLRGEVIGVNDFILSPSGGNIGLSFAISAGIARQVTKELSEKGHVERPWLGVLVAPLDREAKQKLGIEHGVLVTNLYRNSPAVPALRPGDVILKAAGKVLVSPGDLQSVVFGAQVNSKLELEVQRSGLTVPVTVELKKSPRNWSNIQPNNEALPVHLL